MASDISKFVERIVKLPQIKMAQTCKEINRTVDYFEDRQFVGVVSTESLRLLIRRSYTSRSVAGFLASILYFVDSDVLTDDVFQTLLHYPQKKLRRTFLVAISHCPISLYQLEAICKQRICSEAYAQLLWCAATNDCFTLLDVQRIVTENRQFRECVDYSRLVQDPTVSKSKQQFFYELSNHKTV